MDGKISTTILFAKTFRRNTKEEKADYLIKLD
jgi:hypothetical protein